MINTGPNLLLLFPVLMCVVCYLISNEANDKLLSNVFQSVKFFNKGYIPSKMPTMQQRIVHPRAKPMPILFV
jgi:hypothetical protein